MLNEKKNAKQNENISQITKNTEKYRRWILVGQRNNNISFVIHIKLAFEIFHYRRSYCAGNVKQNIQRWRTEFHENKKKLVFSGRCFILSAKTMFVFSLKSNLISSDQWCTAPHTK